MKLTNKQKRFVDEYLVDLNATQAALRAGYSQKTADRIGNENLKKLVVQQEIQKRMKDREKRTEITQDKVLMEFAKIAFANATDYVTVEDKGQYKEVLIKSTKDITEDKLAAISGIKQGANGIEIKLHDKVKALEDIGRHLGMFKDKIEYSGELGLKVIVDYGEYDDGS